MAMDKAIALYGKSLRSLLLDGVARLGVENARVTLEDQGALPFDEFLQLLSDECPLGRP